MVRPLPLHLPSQFTPKRVEPSKTAPRVLPSSEVFWGSLGTEKDGRQTCPQPSWGRTLFTTILSYPLAFCPFPHSLGDV